MTTASLELCKELYELSHWGYNETDKVWCHGKLKNKGLIDTREVHDHFPAYDSGYLLERLLPVTGVDLAYHHRDEQVYALSPSYADDDQTPHGTGESSASALTKLAIELFKQEVLK